MRPMECHPELRAPLSVYIEHVDGVTVASIGGEIDLNNCEELRAALEPCMQPGAILVVDLAAVDLIDASGLKVLVWASLTTIDAGGAFTLRRPTRAVRDLLEATHLDFLLAGEVSHERGLATFPDVIAHLRAQAHREVRENG